MPTLASGSGWLVGVIGIVVSAVGFWFSLRAFRAAREAGRTVKRQTVVVELTAVTQRLDQTSLRLLEDLAESWGAPAVPRAYRQPRQPEPPRFDPAQCKPKPSPN